MSAAATTLSYEASDYNSVESGILIQNAIKPSKDVLCFPAGFNHAERGNNDVVFSPGACPDGYTTNAQAVTVEATVTASCCLSGYSYRSNYDRPEQGCVSTYTGITHVAAGAGGLGTTVDYTTSTTASGPLEMWAQPITIMYQERDLSLYTTFTFASSPSSPTPDTASEPTNPDNNGTSPSSEELSGGTIAGVVVGSIAGMLILLVLAFLLWRRRKGKVLRNIHQSNLQRGALPEASGEKAVKPTSEIRPRQTRSELDAGARQGQGRAAGLE